MNGSYSFYCHEEFIDDLMCASGKSGIFLSVNLMMLLLLNFYGSRHHDVERCP